MSPKETSKRDSEPAPLGSRLELDDTAQRARAVNVIAKSATLVSVLYSIVYAVHGHWLLTSTNASFALFYGVLALKNSHHRARQIGILLMGIGTLQLAGTGTLFISPEGNHHIFLILIPIFSLIAIHPKDRFWWWTYTLIALGFMVWFEWARDTFVPLLGERSEKIDYRTWRVGAALVSVTLVVAVVRVFHRDLHLARKALHASYQRSESLLLNILPATVAERLKGQTGTIADDFPDASVLFADLVGFTQMASRRSASETVAVLNSIFSAFDHAVDEHGLEKIKTMGDAYMVASGVPTPRPDHATQLLRLAITMLEIVRDYNETHGHDLRLRIGVSSGPLTAGVIGAKKFTYDIWGDTVNIASRMESTGLPGRIQVTKKVAHATAGHFEFEERGVVHIKGKGEMETLWVAPAD